MPVPSEMRRQHLAPPPDEEERREAEVDARLADLSLEAEEEGSSPAGTAEPSAAIHATPLAPDIAGVSWAARQAEEAAAARRLDEQLEKASTGKIFVHSVRRGTPAEGKMSVPDCWWCCEACMAGG